MFSYDIVKIIRSLDSNKAHGVDKLSVRMIKICASSISKPLAILFRNCFESEWSPKEWKKTKIVLVHGKVIDNLSKITTSIITTDLF